MVNLQPPEGATRINPVWGESKKIDEAEWKSVTAWLVQNGAPQARLQTYELDPIPGFPPPPTYYQAVFERGGLVSVHDAPLVLASPETALSELEKFFRFGNMTVRKIYPRPQPPTPGPPAPVPQPANPIGPPIEGIEGAYYEAVGDQLPTGSLFQEKDGAPVYKKKGRKQPFGDDQQWWVRIQ